MVFLNNKMKAREQITIIILISILSVVQLACAQEKKGSSKPSKKQFTIDNCVNQFERDKATKTESGYRYWFVDKNFIDGRTLKLSVVAPNQATHPPHEHEEDEFFFVLEGSAKFSLDGETTVVGPYTSLYCPADIAHGISNAGDTELKYLVIKKYPKKD